MLRSSAFALSAMEETGREGQNYKVHMTGLYHVAQVTVCLLGIEEEEKGWKAWDAL